MTSESIELTIRACGRDSVYSSVESLKNALETNFKGKHVSVIYPKPSGMKIIVQATVTDMGEVRHSFGEQLPVDFNHISQNLRS